MKLYWLEDVGLMTETGERIEDIDVNEIQQPAENGPVVVRFTTMVPWVNSNLAEDVEEAFDIYAKIIGSI